MSVLMAVVLLQVFLGIGIFLLWDEAKAMPLRLRQLLITTSGILAALTALYLALTMMLVGGVR